MLRTTTAGRHGVDGGAVSTRPSLLFFRAAKLLGWCLMLASAQSHAADPERLTAGETSPLDGERTVIPGVVPTFARLHLDQPHGKTSAAPNYESLTQQIAATSAASDLVFHGQVVDVAYRAAATETRHDFPLTYVTFSILDIVQGDYSGHEVVLMMPGMGLTLDGRFVWRSYQPIFSKGDELIVFLAGGAVNGPRYLHHFFVVDGRMYDNDSHEILGNNNDEILRGGIVPQSRIFERPLGAGTLRLIRKKSGIGPDGSLDASRRPVGPKLSTHLPLGVRGFGDLVRRRAPERPATAAQAPRPGESRGLDTLESADIAAPLFYSRQSGLVRSAP